MIRSMTGYGDAQGEFDGFAFVAELRSVNNRYLKTSLRVPDELAFVEPEVEGLLRDRLARGSVTLRVRVRDLAVSDGGALNLAMIERYAEQLSQLGSRIVEASLDLASLAQLPGMVESRELVGERRGEIGAFVLELVGSAVERLLAMRKTEGEHLQADLAQHCAAVGTQVDIVAARTPMMVQQYHEKLRQRVQTLMDESGVALATEDLAREVAVYADRSDVNEELARLRAHVTQFTAAMESKEPAGRKLEFIAQEMLREANTIGSKSSDAEISTAVIELKSLIDRIKEQVLNVE